MIVETQFICIETGEVWAIAENIDKDRYDQLCNTSEDELIALGCYQPLQFPTNYEAIGQL